MPKWKTPLIISLIFILIISSSLILNPKETTIDSPKELEYHYKTEILKSRGDTNINITNGMLISAYNVSDFLQVVEDIKSCGGFCKEFTFLVQNPFPISIAPQLNINELIEIALVTTNNENVEIKYYIETFINNSRTETRYKIITNSFGLSLNGSANNSITRIPYEAYIYDEGYQFIEDDENLFAPLGYQDSQTIKVQALFEPKIGLQNIDWQINLDINNVTFDPEWVWFNVSYDFKQNISIDLLHNQVGTLFDVPLNITFQNMTNYVTIPRINGSIFIYYNNNTDYIFVNDSETGQLPHKPMNYTNLTGYLESEIYTNGYIFVMDNEDENKTTGIDSSPRRLNIPMQSSASAGVNFTKGIFGSGRNMTNRIYYSDASYDIQQNLTVEGWYKPTSSPAANNVVLQLSAAGGNINMIVNNKQLIMGGVSTGDDIILNEWNYLAIARYTVVGGASCNYTSYLNGNPIESALDSCNAASIPFHIGGGAGEELFGVIDDIRISNTTRSLDYFRTVYAIGNLTTTFGNQEPEGAVNVNLLTPTDNSEFIPSTNNLTFEVNAQVTNFNITNATLYVWYSNSTLFGTNTTNITGINNGTNLSLSDFIIGNYLWNYLIGYGNNTENTSVFAKNNFSFAIQVNVTNITYSDFSYSTETETFRTHIVAGGGITITNPFLNYDNIVYPATLTSMSNNNYLLSRTIDVPSEGGEKQFNFSFLVDGKVQFTNVINQNILPINLAMCNTSLPIYSTYLNISFEDEVSGIKINATITQADFNYYIGTGTTNKTFSFTNTTLNFQYPFCFSPQNRTINTNITNLFYQSGLAYPQRIYEDNLFLTNETTEKTLLLLSTTSGIYTTFQVINIGNQPLEGVNVKAERQVAGVWTLIEEKNTDDSGSATFWVNPNQPHRFTFSLIGFNDFITIITPTQSAYTITMGIVTPTNIGYTDGVNFYTYPTFITLDNNTDYDFGFYISSTTYTLEEYGFNLINESGFSLGSITGSTGTGSNLSFITNSGNNSNLYLNYFWTINETTVNGSRSWWVQQSYVGEFSVKNFFDDLKSFTNSGFNDFTLALIGFFIIFMFVGWASFSRLTEQPLTTSGLIVALTILLDVGGFFATIRVNPDAVGLPVSVIVSILFIADIIRENLT